MSLSKLSICYGYSEWLHNDCGDDCSMIIENEHVMIAENGHIMSGVLPMLPPLQPPRMRCARFLASSGKSGLSSSLGYVHSATTCRMNVIGCCPMAWQSPMLARITSVNGFLAPCNISSSCIINKIKTKFLPNS
jgi:hypothetical protein